MIFELSSLHFVSDFSASNFNPCQFDIAFSAGGCFACAFSPFSFVRSFVLFVYYVLQWIWHYLLLSQAIYLIYLIFVVTATVDVLTL